MKNHAQTDLSIAALNKGDEHAFSNAFLAYYSALCFFSKGITGDSEAAEDIVEDLFLKLWKRREQFESEQHLKSFLYRSVKNASLNFLKLAQRSDHRNSLFTEEQGVKQESCL